MNQIRRRGFHVILVVLACWASGSLKGQSSLNGHMVQVDSTGKILAWPAVQGDAYGQVLGLAANFLVTGVPTAPNGLKLYYTQSYATGDPLVGAGWPHNPAGLYSMLTDSGLLYYAYSGNVAMSNLVRDVLTYQLDHGMTPSTWNWPSVAYASADAGSLTYAGASYGNSTGVGDGVGVIQPDKVGEIGVAFLKYYEFSGTVRFRDAAIQAANVLASHVRTGTSTQSPWPFRVYAQTNSIREQYSAHVISPIQLFDELIRLNLGNVSTYQAARQTAWNWLMTYPIQNNVWANYFEDVAIRTDQSNVNQLNANETARYLMRHPEFDPNWQTHVRGIVAWVEGRFALPQYGANSIAEQDGFFYPMGSHTSRYGSINAQLYELTGDQAAKENAYRSLNWATYMCGTNGIVIDSPSLNNIWFTDGYGDYIKHFMEALGSVPEWAPQGQSHLLRSSSVVRSVQYAPTEIDYQVFDQSAQEVLRLNFTPQGVTADGVVLSNRTDLSEEGWTFNSVTGVMRVRHDSGTQLRITGSASGNTPPVVSLDSPAPGTYAAPVSLSLAATATDSDGTIDHAEFLQNGTLLGSTSTLPYAFTWTSVPPGNYQLTAAAVDNQGARTTSSIVAIVVSSPTLPPPPTNLVATAVAGGVNLTWSVPVGGPAVATYCIYRSTASGFTPAAGNLIGQPSAPMFSDVGLSAGTYYYRVVAFDALGNPSALSNETMATVAGSLQVDKVVFSDGGGTRISPGITTSKSGELLVAFVSSDGPLSGGQTFSITGASLTWTLVTRMNTKPGSSEVWKATAPGVLTNATVTSTPSRTGYDQSLTVVAFSGAAGIGASATSNGTTAPAVSLTTTRGGSLVYGVGNDWDKAVARTVGPGQAVVHQWVDTPAGDTFWVQNRTVPVGSVGTVVQLNDTAPTTDRWNFAAVEITQVTASITVPDTVGQRQSTAQSQITGAGLVVGTVTSQSSTTIPLNNVLSQNPAGGTQATAGSAVNLVLSAGVTVPDVVGLPQAGAQTQITSANLVIGTVTSQSSSTVPSGTVISQVPAGNTQVSGRTAVNLIVSSGPQLVAVPSVAGQSQASAQSQITSSGLVVGTVTNQSSTTVPFGTVISQSPAGGTQAAAGSAVNLAISAGVTVPNIVGLPQTSAQTQITNASLVVGTVTNQPSSTIPSGSVISEAPAGNAQVSGGTAINLVVSAGPQLVTVPSVVGQPQGTAQSQITGAGFVVGTVTSQQSMTVPIGAVVTQSPAGNTQAVVGSPINLGVSIGVAVPSVVGQPQATAESQITGAGLLLGTETSQSSATVPAGVVMSQNPAGTTQVSGGTPVNLVFSTGPSTSGAPVLDKNVSSDGSGSRTTPAFSTVSANEVLLALVASDGPASGSQSLTISGAGLTWTLVKRVNAQRGSSEIWRAIASGVLTNVTVTSTPWVAGYRQSLTVLTFTGASGTGASVVGSGSIGAPTLLLTTTKSNAVVYAVGNDWDHAVARVPGANQALVHQWVETIAGDTYWVQARTAAVAVSGTVVQINDTSPTNDRWNLAAVEIVP